MERRYLTLPRLSIETRADGKPRIEGYASVYYDGDVSQEYELWSYPGDRCVERVMPGAFRSVLSDKDDVRALFNHDENHVLGRTAAGTLTLTDDSKGLRYSIQPPDTQCARDVMESIRRGDITGSSFSFAPDGRDGQVWRQQRQADGSMLTIRELTAVRIADVGPVVFPAYGAATTGVRSATHIEEARAAYLAWQVAAPLAARLASARARAAEVG